MQLGNHFTSWAQAERTVELVLFLETTI